jgi:putative colanic acid biosynthesis acetyltransferase WcaF
MDAGIRTDKKAFEGPSYTLANRLSRLAWLLVSAVFFRLSPAPLHRWRLLLLRAFGARVSMEAYVYPSTIIWAPWNLILERQATLGRGVNCYNPATVSVGEQAVVSQGAHLCTATHDYNDPSFRLFAKSINIGKRAWVAAESFIGPGVTVGRGAVVGARAVLFRDAPDYTVWVGNPAIMKKRRTAVEESTATTVMDVD